ncbi:MAG: class I SAM-dependent methyltransferase [Bryobacterales bacterium]|nr:class I SAM-dependent methyltransferase [Bryobacterales bacterium]
MLQSELAYYSNLYSGFAQSHFARPAVRAFRIHLVQRILEQTGAGASSRVLSIGCGIGDTELLLAPHVRSLVGIDPSPLGIRQAREDAAKLGVRNAEFAEQTLDGVTGQFDMICGIFVLHHMPDEFLAGLPGQLAKLLAPGGVFYSLDPSVRRLSGAVGRVLVPGLMKKYQTEGERELAAEDVATLFRGAGFEPRTAMYDFGSTPVAGLFPGWRAAYRAARAIDDVLLKIPGVRDLGSNFEVMAAKLT